MTRLVLAGDSRTVLYPEVAWGTVDLLHTDIPYNLPEGGDLTELVNRTGRTRSTRTIRGVVGEYDREPFEVDPHVEAWAPLLSPGAWVVVWHADEQMGAVRAAVRRHLDPVQVQTLVWHVSNPTPVIRQHRLLSAAQFATLARVEGPNRLTERWPGQDRNGHNVWEGAGVGGGSSERRALRATPPDGERELKGQKPLWLARRAAHLFGRPGGLCLDPCVGTGALLHGAMETGMRVLGAERRPWWADDSDRWLRGVETGSLLALATRSTG